LEQQLKSLSASVPDQVHLEAYDKIIGACFEAEKVADKDVQEDKKAILVATSSKSVSRSAVLSNALSAVIFKRVFWSIERITFVIRSNLMKIKEFALNPSTALFKQSPEENIKVSYISLYP
jgi:hypothetical protein